MRIDLKRDSDIHTLIMFSPWICGKRPHWNAFQGHSPHIGWLIKTNVSQMWLSTAIGSYVVTTAGCYHIACKPWIHVWHLDLYVRLYHNMCVYSICINLRTKYSIVGEPSYFATDWPTTPSFQQTEIMQLVVEPKEGATTSQMHVPVQKQRSLTYLWLETSWLDDPCAQPVAGPPCHNHHALADEIRLPLPNRKP